MIAVLPVQPTTTSEDFFAYLFAGRNRPKRMLVRMHRPNKSGKIFSFKCFIEKCSGRANTNPWTALIQRYNVVGCARFSILLFQSPSIILTRTKQLSNPGSDTVLSSSLRTELRKLQLIEYLEEFRLYSFSLY